MLDYEPTRQQAFDLAAKHLMTTRKQSKIEAVGCVYSGSGCALRPFAPNDPDELAEWDKTGSVCDFPSNMLPSYINDDIEFYDRLQAAHDRPVYVNDMNAEEVDELWFEQWKESMQRVAENFNLDASVLNKEPVK